MQINWRHTTPVSRICCAKVERHFCKIQLYIKVQGESDTFEQFITALRLLARDCNFKDADEMIRDRIVIGIKSPKVREKLICPGIIAHSCSSS